MKKLNSIFHCSSYTIRKYLLLFTSVTLVATFLFFSAVFSDYYEQFFVSIPTVEITLKQLENKDTLFSIYFNPDRLPDEDGENLYRIGLNSRCDEYNEYGDCIDPVPDLCPYIALTPNNEEDTEVGFNQSSSDKKATGQLSNSTDMTDNWIITIKSPCFEGECPADYDELQNGAPLAQSLKGQTFKCDLFIGSNEVPVLVMNYLLPKIAYAEDFLNTISVSAVLTGELPACTVDCFSNVLFFPGVMGSKLYDSGLDCGSDLIGDECGEKELWISNNDSLQEKLSLGFNGKSINNIYTKNDTENNGESNETGIVDDVYSFNIYRSFIDDLEIWKNDEKIINDYDFMSYDWRLSLDDVINNGVVSGDNLFYNTDQDFSESFILKKLEDLQKTSKSGKVTIIAHSNGGLVVKALIQKLKDTNNPLYNQIDKVILVAVPQVGTPEAFINLLHGTNIGPLGLVISNERSRQLAENMPAVYNLLPSDSYFTLSQDNLITFENDSYFELQKSEYELDISDETELKKYILGTEEGRSKPSFNDTDHPNLGNSTLYNQAQDVHKVIDNWQPSADTKVIQIAGWGEETLSGLDYVVRTNLFGTKQLSFKPREVIDGDGTVVLSSALWMPSSDSVERWWLNLKTYNELILGSRNHKNILEISNLLNFIKSQITDSVFTDPENIIVNNNSTLISSDIRRLHYTLHSPLTLGITDEEGRYTGMDPATKEIKEEIPDVNYRKIGSVQFISTPTNTAYTLTMQGYESGSFSLDVDEQIGDTITSSTSFQSIPSSTATLATMDIIPNEEISNIKLDIDKNGDGKVDQILQGKENETVFYREKNKERVTSSGGMITNFIQTINNTLQPQVKTKSDSKVVKETKDIKKVSIESSKVLTQKISKTIPKISEQKLETTLASIIDTTPVVKVPWYKLLFNFLFRWY